MRPVASLSQPLVDATLDVVGTRMVARGALGFVKLAGTDEALLPKSTLRA